MERSALFKYGAIQPRANKASLVSLSTTLEGLGKLGVEGHLLESLSKSYEREGMQPIPTPPNNAPPQVVSSTPSLPPQTPLEAHFEGVGQSFKYPTSLPQCDVVDLNKRYGLMGVNKKGLLQEEPLVSQLKAFKSWATSSVQLDRDAKGVCERTWSNIEEYICLYLGFLHTHKGIASPSMDYFLDPPSLHPLH